jgi:hypothetical protein
MSWVSKVCRAAWLFRPNGRGSPLASAAAEYRAARRPPPLLIRQAQSDPRSTSSPSAIREPGSAYMPGAWSAIDAMTEAPESLDAHSASVRCWRSRAASDGQELGAIGEKRSQQRSIAVASRPSGVAVDIVNRPLPAAAPPRVAAGRPEATSPTVSPRTRSLITSTISLPDRL